MFGKSRRQRHKIEESNNELIAQAVETFPHYAQDVVDLSERLYAIDPDYRLVGVGIVGEGVNKTFRLWYAPSSFATDEDRAMMHEARVWAETQALVRSA